MSWPRNDWINENRKPKHASNTNPQEWTPEYLDSFWVHGISNKDALQGICDAHKAALSEANDWAEYERTENAKLRQQLAAEQQKRADWNVVIEDLESALKNKKDELQAFLTDADSARDSWMQALAAERDRREDVERKLRITGDAYDALENHRAATQVELDGADKVIANLKQRNKTLVEALENTERQIRQGYTIDAVRGIAAALAKAKEANEPRSEHL
jgi:chromosome segregation ATPase